MDARIQELERLAKNSLTEQDIANLGHALKRAVGEKEPKKDLEVLYDVANNIYCTTTYWWKKTEYVTRKNSIFFDCLKYRNLSVLRGGSEAIFQSILTQEKYYMWGMDFKKCIPYMINGIIVGWWTFKKKGTSIKLSNESIVRLR